MPWACVISDLNGKEILERFKKKNCKKQIKKSLELKMKSNEELINYILNAKATIILLTGIDKNECEIGEYFPKSKALC